MPKVLVRMIHTMDYSYFDAWRAWASDRLNPSATMWGVPILWWGRVGLVFI